LSPFINVRAHTHTQSIVESNLAAFEESKNQVHSRGNQVHSRGKQSGAWCSGCGLLVVIITMLYAIALTYVLYGVSTKGEAQLNENIVFWLRNRISVTLGTFRPNFVALKC